jgi:hypothetical protein
MRDAVVVEIHFGGHYGVLLNNLKQLITPKLNQPGRSALPN